MVFAALIVGTASGAAVGAPPSRLDVVVFNDSPNCAWITLYTSTVMEPTWAIASDPTSRPRFVKAHQSYRFEGHDLTMSGFKEELKVRAEVMNNAKCEGNRAFDTSKKWGDVAGQRELHVRLKKGTDNFFLAQ